MTKRLIWGIAWLGLAVVLVSGAINRTSAKLGSGEVVTGSSESEAVAVDMQTIHGTALTVDGEMLVVRTDGETEVIVEGQPWAYALGQGFACRPGETVTLLGYPEVDEFKAVQITTSSGAEVTLRGPDGAPMWAGRGLGRGQGQGAGQ